MSNSEHIYRAPMRARAIDAARDAGAAFGLEHGLVGIGESLGRRPDNVANAIDATRTQYGEKAARMLRAFAELPNGTLVWTRTDGFFHLGRISGPWRYEDSSEARQVGIHNVRPTRWLSRPFGEDEVPPAVSATFARGGRNFQRTRDAAAERRTAELWAADRGDR